MGEGEEAMEKAEQINTGGGLRMDNEMGMSNPLEGEYRFFMSKKWDWMGRYEGKHLLIKGRELIDYFMTFADAYKAGVQQFGTELFFVKKLVRFGHPESIPTLELGLISVGREERK